MGKRRKPPQDKRKKPEQDKAEIQNAELARMTDEVQDALGLLDSETADQIIGKANDEYNKLIKAERAIQGMFWTAAKSGGMRQNNTTLHYGAQTMAVNLQLINYAYALGIRRGRENGA